MTSLIVLFCTYVFRSGRTKSTHAADQRLHVSGSQPLHLRSKLLGDEQRCAGIDKRGGPHLDSGGARNQELSSISPVADSAKPDDGNSSDLCRFIHEANSDGPYSGTR